MKNQCRLISNLRLPRMYPFSLTDCSVGRFMRNFISLVRTLFGSVSPAELDECVTLCLVAEKFQTFIDALAAVPTGSKLMTSTVQPTSTLVSSASKPVVPSRVARGDLLVQVSLLLVRRVVLILLERKETVNKLYQHLITNKPDIMSIIMNIYFILSKTDLTNSAKSHRNLSSLSVKREGSSQLRRLNFSPVVVWYLSGLGASQWWCFLCRTVSGTPRRFSFLTGEETKEMQFIQRWQIGTSHHVCWSKLSLSPQVVQQFLDLEFNRPTNL